MRNRTRNQIHKFVIEKSEHLKSRLTQTILRLIHHSVKYKISFESFQTVGEDINRKTLKQRKGEAQQHLG